MKQTALRLLPVLAIALLVACEKKKEETPATTPTTEPAAAQPTPAPTTATVAATAVDINTVPVSEEFEEEADKEITAANVEQKLETIEKEIQAE